MTYSEKLKDPRWQKKRLKVLNRDNWTCKMYEDNETTLHVNHKSYHSSPWETPESELESLCECCHAVVEFNKKYDPTVIYISVLKRSTGSGVRLFVIYIDRDNETVVDVFNFCKGNLDHLVTISSSTIGLLSKRITKTNG